MGKNKSKGSGLIDLLLKRPSLSSIRSAEGHDIKKTMVEAKEEVGEENKGASKKKAEGTKNEMVGERKDKDISKKKKKKDERSLDVKSDAEKDENLDGNKLKEAESSAEKTENGEEKGGNEVLEGDVLDQLIVHSLSGGRRKASELIRKIESSFSASKENAVKTPFSFLLREVSKYALLKPDEERRLAMRFKKYKDKEAAKKLVLANLRFVIKIALDYKNWGVPVEDLVSEGIVGLLFAIRKFDPNKGVKFISYASYWIKAFIHNYILSNFSIIKLGTTQDERRIFANIFKIRDETQEKDIQEQASRLGVDEDRIKLMVSRVRSRDVSLDSPQDDEGSLKLADVITADESFEPISRVEMENSRDFIFKRLNDAFLHLTSQERQVIQQRYLNPRPKTLKELSDELKISKERIRQVEKRAFQKLKTALSKYAQMFRIDMLKDKVRRKRRTKEEMELARMIQMQTGKRKKKKKRHSTKVEPETTEFFDLKNF